MSNTHLPAFGKGNDNCCGLAAISYVAVSIQNILQEDFQYTDIFYSVPMFLSRWALDSPDCYSTGSHVGSRAARSPRRAAAKQIIYAGERQCVCPFAGMCPSLLCAPSASLALVATLAFVATLALFINVELESLFVPVIFLCRV